MVAHPGLLSPDYPRRHRQLVANTGSGKKAIVAMARRLGVSIRANQTRGQLVEGFSLLPLNLGSNQSLSETSNQSPSEGSFAMLVSADLSA